MEPHQRVRVRFTTPGMEHVAANDIKHKLGASRVTVRPGYVEGDIKLSTTTEALHSLFSVEKLSAVLWSGNLPILKTETPSCREALEHINNAIISRVSEQSWQNALTLWASLVGRDCALFWSKKYGNLRFKVEKKKVYSNGNKIGKLMHSFNSTQLAQSVFRAIQSVHSNWIGVLQNPDLRVCVRVHKDNVYVSIPLCSVPLWEASIGNFVLSHKTSGKEGLFFKGRRNLRVRTPLKPTIAYGLVHSANDVKGKCDRTGSIIVDPCCGSGTIGECACLDADGDGRVRTNTEKCSFVISGDMDEEAVEVAADNAERRRRAIGPRKKCMIDVVRWDATRLPLRDGFADTICFDLPFGRRCGSRNSNGRLYSGIFQEVKRIKRYDRAGGVVATALSCDRGNLFHSVNSSGLEIIREHSLNIGGLNGAVVELGMISIH